jgi:hypothetical protein
LANGTSLAATTSRQPRTSTADNTARACRASLTGASVRAAGASLPIGASSQTSLGASEGVASGALGDSTLGAGRSLGDSVGWEVSAAGARTPCFGVRSRVSHPARTARSRSAGLDPGGSGVRDDSGVPFTRSSRVSQPPRSDPSAGAEGPGGFATEICLTMPHHAQEGPELPPTPEHSAGWRRRSSIRHAAGGRPGNRHLPMPQCSGSAGCRDAHPAGFARPHPRSGVGLTRDGFRA